MTIVHLFPSGSIIRQRIYGLSEARIELAHILRAMRNIGLSVTRLGHQEFSISGTLFGSPYQRIVRIDS
jgi:hypothetical protein